MKKLNLRLTVEDLRAAVVREYGERAAARVERIARSAVWERLVAANKCAMDAELASLATLTGPAWLQAQQRLTALFDEHSRLMDARGGTADGGGEVGHG